MKEGEPRLTPVDYLLPYEQGWESSCGPATARIALRALAKFYPRAKGAFITEERVMRTMELPMTGMEWPQMVDLFSEKMGFPTIKATKATYEDLKEEFEKYHFPIIVCWNSERSRQVEGCGLPGKFKCEPGAHFSVIKHIDDENVFIVDPAMNDIFGMTKEQFLEGWYEEDDERCYLAIRPK